MCLSHTSINMLVKKHYLFLCFHPAGLNSMFAFACKREPFVAVFPYPINFFFISVESKVEYLGPCLHSLVSTGPQGAGSVCICGDGQNMVAAAALGSWEAELSWAERSFTPSELWGLPLTPCGQAVQAEVWGRAWHLSLVQWVHSLWGSLR